MLTDLRNLPEPVVKRLGEFYNDRGEERYRRNFDVVQRGRLLEARSASITELRTAENGSPIIDGYATVYEYPYDIAGGPDAYGWSETIAEGACVKSVRERDDVRLLVDHAGIPLARTKPKTLELESDSTGLRCGTPNGVDLEGSPLVQTVISAMRRGDLDEMSFAFRVLRQEWNEDYTQRRILEVKLFDVSLVTFPANPAAIAQLRSDDVPKTLTLAAAQAMASSRRARV